MDVLFSVLGQNARKRELRCGENVAAAERPKPGGGVRLHGGTYSLGIAPKKGVKCGNVGIVADFKDYACVDVILEVLADVGVVKYHFDSQAFEEVCVTDAR